MGLNFFPNLVMWFHYGISYRTGVSSARTFSGHLFSSVCPHYLVLDECLCFGCAVSKNDLGQWSPLPSVVRSLRRLPWLVSSTSLVVDSVGVDPYREQLSRLFSFRPIVDFSKSAKSPRKKPPGLIPLAAWTVIIGGLAFWTQGWADAALDNWSQGAPPLTLIQLAQRADAWEASCCPFVHACCTDRPHPLSVSDECVFTQKKQDLSEPEPKPCSRPIAFP